MTKSLLSDSYLLLSIRQIESSPAAHRPAAIQAQAQANLAALKAEARKRELI